MFLSNGEQLFLSTENCTCPLITYLTLWIAFPFSNVPPNMAQFEVPTSTGPVSLAVEPGGSLVLLGANGAGKTRLGVKIENDVGATAEVHRIGAHRSLVFNTKVQPPSFEVAERRLRYGYDQGEHNHRAGHRWQSQPATALLSDFDHLVAALYADENRTSVLHRQEHLANPNAKPPSTKLDRLKVIWHDLLPHRRLVVLDGDIRVKPAGAQGEQYDASQLSDGERVIFYMIGQVLLTRPNSLVIVDEPELHVNRAILARLWDAIESARKDCAFIYLTHDIEFTVTRRSATKFALHSYVKSPAGEQWELESIPDDTGIPEDVITRIAGSRLPVLFIEGEGGSLDAALYRRVYPEFTTIPVGPCEHVIRSVASFGKHDPFHRLGCAGLIDADGRHTSQTEDLASMNVNVLPVSEVENALLLPKPFVELAKLLKFDDAGAVKKLDELTAFVFKQAKADADRCIIDATRRRVDYMAKAIGLKAKSIGDLAKEFEAKTAKIDPAAIYAELRKEFDAAIDASDYPKILRLYDDKGLLAKASRILGWNGRKELEEFIGRALLSEDGAAFLDALRTELPKVKVKRTLGILAYGSLISDPRAEIADATIKTLTTGVFTPFAVEFARSSQTRKGAPTLVPVETGGGSVRAQIFVLSDDISETEAQDRLWRRETGRTGSYRAPAKPGPNDVLVEALEHFHGLGLVYYTRIGANIDQPSAEKLADLAIASAEAVKRGELDKGKDGISYLIAAQKNGIATLMTNAYEQQIRTKTGTPSLEEAIKKLAG